MDGVATSSSDAAPGPAAAGTGAPPKLAHICWRAAEWLVAFGPLTRTNVLDYFALSPFFERTSSNAQLRMQMQFSRGGMDGVDEEQELKCVRLSLFVSSPTCSRRQLTTQGH